MDNSEWWFVDLVCEMRHDLAVLDSANIEAALNRRSHGLQPTEVRAVLARLRRRGWIEIAGGYYGLTALGGEAWEERAQPDWSRFIDDSCDDDFRYVEGAVLERVRRCIEWREQHYEPVGQPVFERLRPFRATYWKALPEGYRATRAVRPRPPRPTVRCGSPEHAQLIAEWRDFLEYLEFAKWRPQADRRGGSARAELPDESAGGALHEVHGWHPNRLPRRWASCWASCVDSCNRSE